MIGLLPLESFRKAFLALEMRYDVRRTASVAFALVQIQVFGAVRRAASVSFALVRIHAFGTVLRGWRLRKWPARERWRAPERHSWCSKCCMTHAGPHLWRLHQFDSAFLEWSGEAGGPENGAQGHLGRSSKVKS